MDDVALLHALPKAELHCHLEGSVPAETIIELAVRNGVALPSYDPDRLYRLALDEGTSDPLGELPSWVGASLARKYQRPVDGAADLSSLVAYERFLERFDAVSRVLVTPDDFSRATYASLAAAAEDANVRYREMFVHPMNHPGVSYHRMLEGLVDGIRSAEADFGIVGRLIPAINRDHASSVALALVEEVIEHRAPEVLGIASDYDEEHLPAFREAYRVAAQAGLPGTAHAGEYGGPQSITDAIEVLGCTRIDHGYAIVGDAELMARAAAAGIHFAAIFSWSVAIHSPGAWPLGRPSIPPGRRVATPVREMLDGGLAVSLGSDDPAFEGFGNLGEEYVWAAGSLELELPAMIDLCLGAIEGAWLDDGEKQVMRRAFEAEIALLTREEAPRCGATA